MSSISSVNNGSSWAMQGMHKDKQHASVTEMADQAFSALDTSGKGYIDKADLQAMTQKLGTSSTTSTSSSSDSASGVDKLFSALDADGIGQVSKQEFTDTLQKIADQLDQQRHSSRMQNAISQAGLDGQQDTGGAQGMGGPNGMPPPPGGAHGPKGDGDDGGMTKEQMTSRLSGTGSSTATTSNSSGLSSAQVMMQVSRLFEAYIANNNSTSSSASSLSVSA